MTGDKCEFCGVTNNLQTHHWLYGGGDNWTITLCVNCHQKIHPNHGVGRGIGYSVVRGEYRENDRGLIEMVYIVRPASMGKRGVNGKEVTLPPRWCNRHNVRTGDIVKVLASGVMMILPPNISNMDEERVRNFLERKEDGW